MATLLFASPIYEEATDMSPEMLLPPKMDGFNERQNEIVPSPQKRSFSIHHGDLPPAKRPEPEIIP